MLKEYVAKRLSFLQPQGKHTKHHGKREQLVPQGTPEMASDIEDNPADLFAEALEMAAEDVFADVQEDTLESAQEEPEPVCGTSPAPAEESRAEEQDLPAGLRAYEAGRYEEAWAALAGAAGQGNRDAQFLCGQMIQKGLTAEGGDKPALVWYKRAAKQGHTGAQLACAAMYEMGRGTDMDLKRALFWYEQAAKQGSVKAQLKCGCMYFRGRAETRNPKKARRWLEAAANNGSDEAKQILRERF